MNVLSMKKLVLKFILSAMVLAAGPALAGDTNFVGAEWSPVDLQPVLAAAAQITPAQYPNCDSAIVEEKSVRDYAPDGTGECQDETFTKVLTEKGKRDNREFSMSLMLPYFTVSVPKLEIIKPDGTIVPVDVAANSKETIDESQMSENIYDPNMRIFTVNVPQLDVGDIVHVVARQLTQRSIMPAEFDDENILEGSSSIRHWSYEVFAPTNLPLVSLGLRDQVPGTVTSTIQTNGATVDYHWEINNVPRMFDEPNMPPYDEVLQRLFELTDEFEAVLYRLLVEFFLLGEFSQLHRGLQRLCVLLEQLFDISVAVYVGQRGIQRLLLVLKMRRRVSRHFLDALTGALGVTAFECFDQPEQHVSELTMLVSEYLVKLVDRHASSPRSLIGQKKITHSMCHAIARPLCDVEEENVNLGVNCGERRQQYVIRSESVAATHVAW